MDLSIWANLYSKTWYSLLSLLSVEIWGLQSHIVPWIHPLFHSKNHCLVWCLLNRSFWCLDFSYTIHLFIFNIPTRQSLIKHRRDVLPFLNSNCYIYFLVTLNKSRHHTLCTTSQVDAVHITIVSVEHPLASFPPFNSYILNFSLVCALSFPLPPSLFVLCLCHPK